MDPITWVTVLNIVKKYWWIVLVIAILIYIYILHLDMAIKTSTIEKQKQTITKLSLQITDYQSKISAQNKAIDLMTKKGIEQEALLNNALIKANRIKLDTQETIREIYFDKTQDISALLRNAMRD